MADRVAEQILERLQVALVSAGLPAASAMEVSAQVMARVCSEIGGERVYLPRRSPWANRAMRDRAIAAAYNGRNIDQVCDRFGVSRATVYRAMRK